MAKKNYAAICRSIISVCGGTDNISNVSHCMTRLRISLHDTEKINTDRAGKIPGVLNLVIQNGEYQFVIGQDVAQLYEEFEKAGGICAGGAISEEEVPAEVSAHSGRPLETVLSFIGGTFSPVIPVLVAGGLTGAVLTFLTTFFGISTESGTYTVIYAINQATFFFLPVFIGFSAAQRLKSNGFLGAFLGAILVFSSINGQDGLSFLGIPIPAVTYNSTVFPVILGVLFLSALYRWLQKVMPVFLRTIFVPLITILVAVPATLIILGPIGNEAGTLLASGVLAVYRAAPPFAVMIVGTLTCWMVFFGMNNATYPIVFALLAEVNSDPLICMGMAPANVAVGGACLAAALISQNVEEKSIAAGAGLTALCGITEPGVYGVLFVKRYPLIGAMAGGGLGGLIAGIMGTTQYAISTPGFISFAAYIDPDGTPGNLIWAMAEMVIAMAAAFGVTYVLGRRKEQNA